MLDFDSNLKIGLYSSYQDKVIGVDYLEMTSEEYEQILVSLSSIIHNNHPQSFKRFFVNGESHCIQDYGYSVNSVSIYDWVEALVNDREDWVEQLE